MKWWRALCNAMPFVRRSRYDELRLRLIAKHEEFAELGLHVEQMRQELHKYRMLVAANAEQLRPQSAVPLTLLQRARS